MRPSRVALNAAETGHLVLSRPCTPSTLPRPINRSHLGVFLAAPAETRCACNSPQVLKAIVSMRLVPQEADGTEAVRLPSRYWSQHAVHPRVHREQGKDKLIISGADRRWAPRQYSMQTFDQSLYNLLQGRI